MKDFIALFPGQGSQSVGMGKEFLEKFDLARDLFAEADKALGFPLSKLCLEGPLEELTLTQNAQPAILTVSTIAFHLLENAPKAGAGHSLGEYSALVAAGALTFSDAVQLVHKRGKYMQEAVPTGAGKMIAVLGPEVSAIEEAIAAVPTGIKQVANINCPGQTVVSGDVAGIDALSAELLTRGAKVIELKVSAPFHCSMMAPAAEKLLKDIAALSIKAPKFPVYSNVTTTPHTDGESIRKLLVDQVCSPVRWTASVENMIRDTQAATTLEFGAGSVLSNLMKRIDKSKTRLEISTPETLEKTRASLAA